MNKTSLSRLESVVADYIAEMFPELIVVPQARVIKRTKKTRFEIDLYIPELKLGFEIQDFTTHSKTIIEKCEKARNPWGKPMKDPAYHSRKAELALKQLDVTIVELWEDEIENGSFVFKINREIQKRLPPDSF